jgi:hypothetical protein
MTDPERRTGRPVKAVPAGQRASLGLKVTSEIKQRLDGAARANGRTQSQEAEARLEQSFRDEDLLPQILDLAYGRQTAALLMLLGRSIRDASSHAAFDAEGSLASAENWMNHPWAYQQAWEATRRIFDVFRPSSEPLAPRSRKGLPQPVRAALNNLGCGIAEGVIAATVHPDDTPALSDVMKPARERLGEVINRIKGDGDAG